MDNSNKETVLIHAPGNMMATDFSKSSGSRGGSKSSGGIHLEESKEENPFLLDDLQKKAKEAAMAEIEGITGIEDLQKKSNKWGSRLKLAQSNLKNKSFKDIKKLAKEKLE